MTAQRQTTATVVREPAPQASRFRSLVAEHGVILAIFLITKTLTLLLGIVAWQVINDQNLWTWRAALAIWNLWDAPHYLDLAQYGYEATGERSLWLVFYPLFPALTHLAGQPFNDYLLGSFIVATLASFLAAFLLYRLCRLDHDIELARGTVYFFAIFPTSYFLHIGYTEGLFIALSLAAIIAGRHLWWMPAGLLGGLACLTRVNGLILLPTLAAEAYLYYRRTGRLDWRWLWLLLVPLGYVGYLAINYRVTGNPFAFTTILREHWYKGPGTPWQGVIDIFRSHTVRSPAEQQTVIIQQILFLAIGIVGTIVAFFRLRLSYGVWMASNLLLYTSTTFILSMPRYTLTLFPLYILFAQLARRHPVWQTLLTVWSILFLALFTILYLLQKGLAY